MMKKVKESTIEDSIKEDNTKEDNIKEDRKKKALTNKVPENTIEDSTKEDKKVKKVKDSCKKLDLSLDMDHPKVLNQDMKNKILVKKAMESITEAKASIMEANLNTTVERASIMEVETLPSISQLLSTGEPRVPLPQSRTKDNVAHAGLSQPPDLLKVPTF